jgi:hypothetical protein
METVMIYWYLSWFLEMFVHGLIANKFKIIGKDDYRNITYSYAKIIDFPFRAYLVDIDLASKLCTLRLSACECPCPQAHHRRGDELVPAATRRGFLSGHGDDADPTREMVWPWIQRPQIRLIEVTKSTGRHIAILFFYKLSGWYIQQKLTWYVDIYYDF